MSLCSVYLSISNLLWHFQCFVTFPTSLLFQHFHCSRGVLHCSALFHTQEYMDQHFQCFVTFWCFATFPHFQHLCSSNISTVPEVFHIFLHSSELLSLNFELCVLLIAPYTLSTILFTTLWLLLFPTARSCMQILEFFSEKHWICGYALWS